MNIRLYYVVPRQKLPFYNLVSTRCLFSRLDFLIRKVGAGCRSEPEASVLCAPCSIGEFYSVLSRKEPSALGEGKVCARM